MCEGQSGDRMREALMLVENLHGDNHYIFRAVAMHALGRPDAIGYLVRMGVNVNTMDGQVRQFLGYERPLIRG